MEQETNDAVIHRFCLQLMERLQAVYQAEAPAYAADGGEHHRPCASCAIKPYGNRAKGMEKTALGFFAALQTGQPFYCHDGAPYAKGAGWKVDPATAPLCAAWWVVMLETDRPRLMRLFDQAMTATFGPMRPVDDEAFDLLAATVIGMVA